MIHEYPYTDFHEMNLDWIIREMKKLVDDWASFATNVTASAHEASQPEVTVTGDLKTGIDFDFGLVKGPEGPEGPEGPQGKGLDVLGVYATLSDLQTAHPTGTPGDVYLVGSGGSYTMYVWSEDDADWVDGGPITSPAPAVSNPLMDGTAAVGTSQNYAREDHVHPSDSSKQDTLVSGTNIKTINSESLLGSTDIALQEPLVSGTNIKTINSESLLGSTDIAVQIPLVSGTNIKTINSESLLGSTNIAVQVPLVSGSNIKTINSQDILGSGDLTISTALTIDLLWSNADTTVSFAAQTISDIDISSYKFFIIVFNASTGAQYRSHQSEIIMDKDVNYTLLDTAGGTFRTRKMTVNSTGSITFDDNYNNPTYASTGNMAVDNSCTIPVSFYGVK